MKQIRYIPTEKAIEIKPQEEDQFEKTTNLALIAIRRKQLKPTAAFEKVKQKISELNIKVRKKTPRKVANIIQLWLKTP